MPKAGLKTCGLETAPLCRKTVHEGGHAESTGTAERHAVCGRCGFGLGA